MEPTCILSTQAGRCAWQFNRCRVRIADFSHSVILAEADSRMFGEQLQGDARYIAPEYIFTGGQTGAPKLTKEGDVYSYGCVAILVRCAAHQLSMHSTLLFSRYCRERCRTGGFRKRAKCFQKRKGRIAFSSYCGD
ncbi:hypothetical protein BDR06DRAFT_621293 [Suillus hirtellus]|nr:hypothetical protein BDR06DRAFT_621293 [Suillus hirtellus]